MTKFLDLLLELGSTGLENVRVKLAPWYDRPLFDSLAMFLVDRVDLGVELVLGFHVDELLELGDGKVEQVFRENILVLLEIELLALCFVLGKFGNTIFKRYGVSSWSNLEILCVRFLQLFLECYDLLLGNLRKGSLERFKFEVSSLGSICQCSPVVCDGVNRGLIFLINLVLVHPKHSELLLNF